MKFVVTMRISTGQLLEFPAFQPGGIKLDVTWRQDNTSHSAVYHVVLGHLGNEGAPIPVFIDEIMYNPAYMTVYPDPHNVDDMQLRGVYINPNFTLKQQVSETIGVIPWSHTLQVGLYDNVPCQYYESPNNGPLFIVIHPKNRKIAVGRFVANSPRDSVFQLISLASPLVLSGSEFSVQTLRNIWNTLSTEVPQDFGPPGA